MGRRGPHVEQDLTLQELPEFLLCRTARGLGGRESLCQCGFDWKCQEAQLNLAELKISILAQLPEQSRGSSASGPARSRCCDVISKLSLSRCLVSAFLWETVILTQSLPSGTEMMTGSSGPPAGSAIP